MMGPWYDIFTNLEYSNFYSYFWNLTGTVRTHNSEGSNETQNQPKYIQFQDIMHPNCFKICSQPFEWSIALYGVYSPIEMKPTDDQKKV